MQTITGTVVLARPALGDHYHRYSLNGLYEESMVISILGPENHPEQWTAAVMTRNGIEFVSGSSEIRGKFDWVPNEWTFDDVLHVWVNPRDENGEIVGEVVPFEEKDIPTPKIGEKYMSWRARAYREVDGLKGHKCTPLLLKKVWKARELTAVAQ